MAKLIDKLMQRALGDTDAAKAGISRTVRGLRAGDRTDLTMGLVLSALAYLKRTKPRKTLIYRQEVKRGHAVVIRNTESGQPPVVVENPKA